MGDIPIEGEDKQVTTEEQEQALAQEVEKNPEREPSPAEDAAEAELKKQAEHIKNRTENPIATDPRQPRSKQVQLIRGNVDEIKINLLSLVNAHTVELIKMQRETHRLLRKIAGEPEPDVEKKPESAKVPLIEGADPPVAG